MARRRREPATDPEPKKPTQPSGPGVALLDTLRRGEWDRALDMLPADAQLSVPQFKLYAEGRDLRVFINDSLFFFPDLSYHPHTRMTGEGIVIDEGFVQGTPPPTIQGGHPMSSSIKVTAHHNDTEVRLLVVDLDPTPIQQALGRKVDRPAAIYSEMQNLRAGMYDHLEVHDLSAPAEEETPPPAAGEGRGRRGLGSFLRRR